MSEITQLIAYLLSSCGFTILIVWPQDGPSAWLRERVGKKILRGKAGEVFDCYICCGFWSGLVLSPLWWIWFHEPYIWLGCLIVPFVFWLILRPFRSG